MGTSMSDSNSVQKSKSVPRRKFANSGVQQHKSLKKIQLKNITDNPRYLSHTRIGQKQVTDQKMLDNKNIVADYYFQNDLTPAFSSQIKDKALQLGNTEFQIKIQSRLQKSIKARKNDQNYFIYVDKSQSNKKSQQKNQSSRFDMEQEQLKLPLSSLVKQNALAQLISFSQIPSTQNSNKQVDQQIQLQQKQRKNEILKMLKEEKQQHRNKIKNYLPKSNKLRQSYFTYGLSNYQGPQQRKQQKVINALRQSKLLQNKNYKEKVQVKSKRIKQKNKADKTQVRAKDQAKQSFMKNPSLEDEYFITAKSDKVISNLSNVNVIDQIKKRMSKKIIQKLNVKSNHRQASNFTSSSKTKSEKRLNLLYF